MKLDELATRSGVSARTVRYYIQRGLLSAPAFRGPETSYDESHLERLRAIRKLQDAHLPLEEIAATLAERTAAEVLKGADTARTSASRSARGSDVARAERRRLATGVELVIDDDAPAWARALADTLTDMATAVKARRR